MKDPVSATMGGFSKVTNFLKDALLMPAIHRPSDEYAELMPDLEGLSVNLQAEQGYELISQSQVPHASKLLSKLFSKPLSSVFKMSLHVHV